MPDQNQSMFPKSSQGGMPVPPPPPSPRAAPTPPDAPSPDHQQNKAAANNFWLFIWDLVKVFVISLAIILPVRYFIAQPFIVSGSSMEPTFHSTEYLIIDELSYHQSQPQRGDVIVFKYPKDNSQYFIKRIIGLPGETVQIIDGGVKITNNDHPNGVVLDEPYLPANNITLGSSQSITLGSDEFYVLGDNRMASSDSRFWGTVPRNDIIGKVFVRAFPFQNFTRFTGIHYSGV